MSSCIGCILSVSFCVAGHLIEIQLTKTAAYFNNLFPPSNNKEQLCLFACLVYGRICGYAVLVEYAIDVRGVFANDASRDKTLKSVICVFWFISKQTSHIILHAG